MKKEKKTNKLLKLILIFVGIIVTIFVLLIAYIVVVDLRQEDILKKEIVNLSNKDLLTDDYKIEVKTTGDYAYIEEAVKKFYKELSDSVKNMNKHLNNDELINILSAENLKNDGPNFNKSYQTIETTRTNLTTSLQIIANLCKEETIKNLIDKEKVDEYSYELYLQLMYTEDDLKSFAKTNKQMEELSANLNLFLDKVTEMLKMLEKNNGFWEIENNELYFHKDSLVNEYNKLYDELNQIVKEKFSNSTSNQSNTSNNI